jgi:acyl carrier protein
MKQLTELKIIELFSKILKIKKDKIDINLSSNNTEEWDSINHLNLMVEIDTKLNGKAKNIPELSTAHSLKKICAILKKHKLMK